MRIPLIRGATLALATGLLSLTVAACDDDSGTTAPTIDLSAVADMAKATSSDMAVAVDAGTPSVGQITIADVVGTLPTPNADGGITLLPLTHVLVTQVSFPAATSHAQHSDPNPLQGCQWNRYDLVNGPGPGADEQAGQVSISGYTTSTIAVNTTNGMNQTPIASPINCKYGSGALPNEYDCRYGDVSTGDLTSNYIYPYLVAASMEQHPLTSAETITFAAPAGGTFTDQIAGTVALASATGNGTHATDPLVILTVNGTASTMGLGDVQGKFGANATSDLTITWACVDSTGTAGTTAGANCPTGAVGLTDLVGLLVKTSVTPDHQFGTATCVDQTGAADSHTITLTKQAMKDILGSDANQTAQFILVHLKASPQQSGAHEVFLTAGRGSFAVIQQAN